MSTLKAYCRSQALYNRWANDRVNACILHLSDRELFEPLSASGKPIHFVLNHVLVIDKLWLDEIQGRESTIESSTEILHHARAPYIADRRRTDEEIVRVTEGFSEQELDAQLFSESDDGSEIEWPFILELGHVFRHQVHHRGQVSILLAQTSAPALKIDQLFVPDDSGAARLDIPA